MKTARKIPAGTMCKVVRWESKCVVLKPAKATLKARNETINQS